MTPARQSKLESKEDKVSKKQSTHHKHNENNDSVSIKWEKDLNIG